MLGDPFVVRCGVAEPVNEVLVASAGVAVVEDLFDFEYFVIVVECRTGARRLASGEQFRVVCGGRFQ